MLGSVSLRRICAGGWRRPSLPQSGALLGTCGNGKFTATVLVTDTAWRFKIVGVNSQCIPASPGVRRKRVVRGRVAKPEMLTDVALFLPSGRTKDRQRPASAGTKRRQKSSDSRSDRAGAGGVQHAAAKAG